MSSSLVDTTKPQAPKDKRSISKYMNSSESPLLKTKYGLEQFVILPLTVIDGVVSNRRD